MEVKLSLSEDLTPVSLEKIAAFIASIQKKTVKFPGLLAERPIPGIM